MNPDVSSSASKSPTTEPHASVLQIVAELSPLGVTDVTPDTRLVAELGFDSLGLVELMVALEDALEIPPIGTEILGSLERVEDLERVVREAESQTSPD